jgi:hypothetical protein
VVQEGQSKWGGTQYPSNQGWAVFRVLVDLITVPALTDIATLQKQMVAMCNFWKPARCILDSVQFQWHLLRHSDSSPQRRAAQYLHAA